MSKRKTFIDPERQSIIKAGLSRLDMDPFEIADAIEKYDLNALPPTQCKILGSILPTEEECQKIRNFDENL